MSLAGCFGTTIPGVCCPVYLCPTYLDRNETSYTLSASQAQPLDAEAKKIALAKFCRIGARFLSLNEKVIHIVGAECQTCECKHNGIVCEPGCGGSRLIHATTPPVIQTTTTTTTTTTTPAPDTRLSTGDTEEETPGQRSKPQSAFPLFC